MVTQGNHEFEKIPVVHNEPSTTYNARWKMSYEESRSDSNLYCSLNVTGVQIIMLGSYTDFYSESNQYKWLEGDLKKVNRKNTPCLVGMVHAPWYNSNTAHQGEKESVNMKVGMEDLLYQARVDVIFVGHVHVYERFVSTFHFPLTFLWFYSL
ncbi:putative Acid phosphatase [Lupinus albus]|uniref:acid phosphatase n=1 Tax=Lupinus albus TaxID=3870 RepID=A0A6A4NT48_LUPAL|nr:putative Acid phosphatase [Lupinus albus]